MEGGEGGFMYCSVLLGKWRTNTDRFVTALFITDGIVTQMIINYIHTKTINWK